VLRAQAEMATQPGVALHASIASGHSFDKQLLHASSPATGGVPASDGWRPFGSSGFPDPSTVAAPATPVDSVPKGGASSGPLDSGVSVASRPGASAVIPAELAPSGDRPISENSERWSTQAANRPAPIARAQERNAALRPR
jgi:hypothetical protein